MVIKKCDDGTGRVTVTFTLEAMEDLPGVYLVGDFNDWNPNVNPMYHGRNGMWWLSLDLEPNQTYEYRYWTAEGEWIDNPATEALVSTAV